MPYGTAVHRLKKSVMFAMSQKLGQDVCYRCGNKIETVEEFSVEHKEAWYNKNPKLFWDLDNIAFSHLVCNIKAAHKKGIKSHRRKEGPVGTSWCHNCRDFLPISRFGTNPSRWDGFNSRCKICHAALKKK